MDLSTLMWIKPSSWNNLVFISLFCGVVHFVDLTLYTFSRLVHFMESFILWT